MPLVWLFVNILIDTLRKTMNFGAQTSSTAQISIVLLLFELQSGAKFPPLLYFC